MIEFFQPPRRLSCGVVIVNDAHELLLCHVTGHDHWDLPKGGAMAGETARRPRRSSFTVWRDTLSASARLAAVSP